jgi:2-C-methyl-D-erythritol 4-phosphate cytidylyltransferase
VLVHDAARCLVQAPWVEQLIREVGDDAVGGILAWPLSDTLKQARPCNPIAGDTAVPNERIVATIPRAHKWLAQTPQMFRLGALRQALERALQEMQRPKAGQGAGLEPLVTDEASALEAMGLSPLLVQASALNIKITYAEDFVLAQALLGVLGDV